mmetsp:Transcript_23842/g.67040  ORF Transcript_23842/g.67040 Transcript_23842/m.67040 type:complete len:214 (-) Transcript_23842:1187-1828(-)
MPRGCLRDGARALPGGVGRADATPLRLRGRRCVQKGQNGALHESFRQGEPVGVTGDGRLDPEGVVGRRRRARRREAGAPRDGAVPRRARGEVQGRGAAPVQGRFVLRPAGLRQDAPGPGGGPRVRRELREHQGPRAPHDVVRRERGERPRALREGARVGALHPLLRRDRRHREAARLGPGRRVRGRRPRHQPDPDGDRRRRRAEGRLRHRRDQ